MNRTQKRWLPLAVALTAATAACDTSGPEEGVLPEGPPAGEVVDLETHSPTGRIFKAHRNAVHESRDGGASWQAVPLPASLAGGEIADVAIPAGAERALYVAGPGIGVLRSEDEGRTWTALGEGLPSRSVTALAAHANQPETVYAFVADEGIYRSEDGGETWTGMDSGPGGPIREFVHSDMEGSMQTGWLFAATEEGVRRSMDCFCGWRPTGELPGGTAYDVAYDLNQPKRVYAATPSGVFLSEDGGESWAAVSEGSPAVIALAVDDSGALYAATSEGLVLQSADLGRSWEPTGA